MTHVAIVGSRDYPHLNEVEAYVKDRLKPGDVVVTGGARGVDTVAENTARELGHDVITYPADWDTYGKSAGFLRNALIVDAAERVVAFWYRESRGTRNTIDLAMQHGKNLEVFFA